MKTIIQTAVIFIPLFVGCSKQPEKRLEDLRGPDGIKTAMNLNCVKVLENAERFEVLSVDPELGGEGEYQLIGKTTITNKAIQRRVVDALYQSVDEGGSSAFCFDPRHVVRVSTAGHEYDFVICFECMRMQTRGFPNMRNVSCPISTHAKSILDKVLVDAGVRLAATR